MATKTGVMLTVCSFAVSIFFLSGCSQNSTMAGKDTLKDPFAGKYSVKNLPRQPTNPAQRDVPLKEPPEMSAAAYERSGDDYFNSGNLQQAFLQYDKSVRLEPENPRVRYKIGLLFLLNKMYDDAILEFQGVLKKEPQNALAYEGMGLALFQQQKIAEAERYFTKAIELNQNLWKSHNCLGIIYDKRKDYQRAIAAYQKAIAIKQDNALLYNNLGLSYLFSGNYDSAIKAFDTAMGFRSVPNKVYNNMGLALGLSGRYQEALETFKKVSDEATAYNNLGCVLLMKGDYQKANQAFEKAIKLKPSFYTIANENLKKARTGASGSSKLDFLTDKAQPELVKAEDFNLEELPPPKMQEPEPQPVIKEPPTVTVQNLREEQSGAPTIKKQQPRDGVKPEPSKKPQKIASISKTEPAQKTARKAAPDEQQARKTPLMARTEMKQPDKDVSPAPRAEKNAEQQSGGVTPQAQEKTNPPVAVPPPQPASEKVAVPSSQPDITSGKEPVAAAKTDAPIAENAPPAAPVSGGEAVVHQDTVERPETAPAPAPPEQAPVSNLPSATTQEEAPANIVASPPVPITEPAPKPDHAAHEESKIAVSDTPGGPDQAREQAAEATPTPAPHDAVPAPRPQAEAPAAPGGITDDKPAEKQPSVVGETGAPVPQIPVSAEPAAVQKPEAPREAEQAGAQVPSGEETTSVASPAPVETPAGGQPGAEAVPAAAVATVPATESTPQTAHELPGKPVPAIEEPPAPLATEQKKEEFKTESEAEKIATLPSAETAVTSDKTSAPEIKPAEKTASEPVPAIPAEAKKAIKPPEPKTAQKPVPAKKDTRKQVVKAAPQKAPKPQYHVVAPGETLMSLSRKYNTDVATLRKLNGLYEESTLKVGAKLRVN